MRNAKQKLVLTMVALLLVVVSGRLDAQNQFVPFNTFVANTTTAGPSAYVGQPGYLVQDSSTFQAMQQYVLAMYQGVSVSHSFQLDGLFYDCVPIQQQPSVRLLGITSISPAPPQADGPSAANTNDAASLQLASNQQYDQFGNSTTCESNTIPMQRITLETLSRFPTLQSFFSKGPDGLEYLPGSDAPAPAGHKYAYTNQTVDNHGGNSALNVWSPNVDTTKGQVFSLSQQWYAGGAGNNTQTVEGGWQNYPQLYGDQNSRLFIFWTADNYQNDKCYNLSCPAFVQINQRGILGARFSNYSTSGGTQYSFTMLWWFYNGDWWLSIGNSGARQWIGYYPGRIFKGGQLTRNAQTITYGGETASSDKWGPMGSGAWPDQGFKFAAYQRQVYYIDTTEKSKWANLTAQQPSPKCYKLAGPNNGADVVWGVYFYFGGPGGDTCE